MRIEDFEVYFIDANDVIIFNVDRNGRTEIFVWFVANSIWMMGFALVNMV